jgi:hypothetical protein
MLQERDCKENCHEASRPEISVADLEPVTIKPEPPKPPISPVSLISVKLPSVREGLRPSSPKTSLAESTSQTSSNSAAVGCVSSLILIVVLIRSVSRIREVRQNRARMRCAWIGLLVSVPASGALVPIEEYRLISPATVGFVGSVLGRRVFSCTSVRQVRHHYDLSVMMTYSSEFR